MCAALRAQDAGGATLDDATLASLSMIRKSDGNSWALPQTETDAWARVLSRVRQRGRGRHGCWRVLRVPQRRRCSASVLTLPLTLPRTRAVLCCMHPCMRALQADVIIDESYDFANGGFISMEALLAGHRLSPTQAASVSAIASMNVYTLAGTTSQVVTRPGSPNVGTVGMDWFERGASRCDEVGAAGSYGWGAARLAAGRQPLKDWAASSPRLAAGAEGLCQGAAPLGAHSRQLEEQVAAAPGWRRAARAHLHAVHQHHRLVAGAGQQRQRSSCALECNVPLV